MNLCERFVVRMLAAFDRCMDVVTFGMWERIRGEVTWNEIKVNKE